MRISGLPAIVSILGIQSALSTNNNSTLISGPITRTTTKNSYTRLNTDPLNLLNSPERANTIDECIEAQWLLLFDKNEESVNTQSKLDELTEKACHEALTQFKQLHGKEVTCSISYAWEPPGSELEKIDDQKQWITRFASHLEMAGCNVTLDLWDNLHTGRVPEFVKNVVTRDKVFLIGTPLLKHKSEQAFRVVYHEVKALSERLKNEPDYLYLVLREGDHSLAFPDVLTDYASTDMRQKLDYHRQLIAMLGKAMGLTRYHTKYSEFEKLKVKFVEKVTKYTAQTEIKNTQINLPKRNADFVGRRDILNQIRSKFIQDNARIVIHAAPGLGGIGKTQTALEYAHRFSTCYAHIIWVDASSTFTLLQGMQGFAKKAGMIQIVSIKNHLKDLINEWFHSHPNSLLILDNAEDTDLIERYLPTKGGHVLITAQHYDFADHLSYYALELGVLNKKEAYTLLRNLTQIKDQEKALCYLSDLLGRLPLALVAAGSYIRKSESSVTDYIYFYKKKRNEHQSIGNNKPEKYPLAAYTAYRINMETIIRKMPFVASAVLGLSALMYPNQIPQKILDELKNSRQIILLFFSVLYDVADFFRIDLPTQENPFKPVIAQKTEDIIEVLQEYSLLRYDKNQKTYNIHQIVQEIARDYIGVSRQDFVSLAMMAIQSLWRQTENLEGWPLRAQLSAHGITLTDYLIQGNYETINEAIAIQMNIADHYKTIGEYDLAGNLYEKMLETCNKLQGTEIDYDCNHIYNSLGFIVLLQGINEDAIRHFEKQMESQLDRHGSEIHEDVVKSHLILGSLLITVNNRADAKKHIEKAIETLNLQLFMETHLILHYLGISLRLLLEPKDGDKLANDEYVNKVFEKMSEIMKGTPKSKLEILEDTIEMIKKPEVEFLALIVLLNISRVDIENLIERRNEALVDIANNELAEK